MQSTNLINLESLIELSVRLIEFKDYTKILKTSLFSLMGKLRFSKSFILIPKENQYNLKSFRKSDIVVLDYFEISDIYFPKKNEILLQNGIEICIPVQIDNKTNVVFCLGGRYNQIDLSKEEIKYAKLVASITSTAIKNTINLDIIESKKSEAERKSQLLRTLFEISKDFNSILNQDEIIKLFAFHLMGQLTVTKFAIIEIVDNEYYIKLNKFKEKPENKLLSELIRNNKIVLLNDFVEKICPEKKYLEMEVAVPLQIQGEIKGILIIGKKLNKTEFNEENFSFLESLANIFISAIENERLFKEEIEKKQLESELSYAREIQQRLLPSEIPKILNYDIHGLSIPSRDVGGDYFDIIKIDENKTLFAVADVSGKGMPAALIMANIQSALKVSVDKSTDLLEITSNLNKLIFENTAADKFVTLFIGILNNLDNSFTYLNAGHNPAIFVTDSHIEYLKSSGLLLGFDGVCDNYEIKKIELKKDDLIYIYTDGVNEAENIEKEDYGIRRVIEKLKMERNKNSKQINNLLLESIYDYTEGNSQYDDITMITIKSVN